MPLTDSRSTLQPSPERFAGQAVTTEGLSHSYGDRTALNDVSFSVLSGELFAILGPNGGGKTTAFKILTTLLRPAGGRAYIWGRDVVAERDQVRRLIGVVFQSPALDVKLTVKENILHHGHLYGLSGRPLRERIDESLERMALRDRARDLVETLSGGLRRRIELAKALLSRPRVLLMDEPTAGLDPGARDDFWRLINEMRSETGMTVIHTTHHLEEADFCDRIAIFDRGRLVALDSPVALRAEIKGDMVTLRGTDLGALESRLRTELGARSQLAGDCVRVLATDGHAFASAARESLGPLLDSVSIARPTLADVFRQRSGHDFWAESDQTGDRK